MTYALKFAKAAPAIAMSYLSVVWGLLGGFFFFHEVCIIRKLSLKAARSQIPPLLQAASAMTPNALSLQLQPLLHPCCVAIRLVIELYVLLRAPCHIPYALPTFFMKADATSSGVT